MATMKARQYAANAAGSADEAAFEIFMRAHEGAIFAYLWRMTGDEQIAYDLSQETFLRAWRRFARIATYERPAAWLFRVATNLALNHAQRRNMHRHDALLRSPAEATGDDPAARIAEADLVLRTLQALAPRRRAVLVLHDASGLTTREVANALSMRPGAVRMALSRAREEFRLRYTEGNDAP